MRSVTPRFANGYPARNARSARLNASCSCYPCLAALRIHGKASLWSRMHGEFLKSFGCVIASFIRKTRKEILGLGIAVQRILSYFDRCMPASSVDTPLLESRFIDNFRQGSFSTVLQHDTTEECQHYRSVYIRHDRAK